MLTIGLDVPAGAAPHRAAHQAPPLLASRSRESTGFAGALEGRDVRAKVIRSAGSSTNRVMRRRKRAARRSRGETTRRAGASRRSTGIRAVLHMAETQRRRRRRDARLRRRVVLPDHLGRGQREGQGVVSTEGSLRAHLRRPEIIADRARWGRGRETGLRSTCRRPHRRGASSPRAMGGQSPQPEPASSVESLKGRDEAQPRDGSPGDDRLQHRHAPPRATRRRDTTSSAALRRRGRACPTARSSTRVWVMSEASSSSREPQPAR